MNKPQRNLAKRLLGSILPGLFRQPCTHSNLEGHRWLDWNDKPGVSTFCPDCGFSEHVYVSADPKTWCDS